MKTKNLIHPDVNAQAVADYFSNLQTVKDGGEGHMLEIWQDGETIVRVAKAPYQVDDRREVHSLSKIFTSTAIGCLYDEGKIHLEDKIVNYFPEEVAKMKEAPSKRLQSMTLKHVLAMQTGHGSCVMPQMYQAEDSILAFLEAPIASDPGGRQWYNTGASGLLGAVIRKFTGLNVLDYLEYKILAPMEMENLKANTIRDGHPEAGSGVHCTCDDLIKLGRLYLQGGVWNGRRLLSEAYISMATTEQSFNGNHDSDMSTGYGLHWWLNYRDGFRGDGARGQLCLVLPKHHAVVATMSNLEEMQPQIDIIMDMMAHLHDDNTVHPVIPAYVPTSPSEYDMQIPGGVYRLAENTFGFTMLRLSKTAEELKLMISDGVMQQTIHLGKGCYLDSRLWAKKLTPKLPGLMLNDFPEEVRLSGAYTVLQDGSVRAEIRYRSNVHIETWHLAAKNSQLEWVFENERFRTPDCRRLVGSHVGFNL